MSDWHWIFVLLPLLHERSDPLESARDKFLLTWIYYQAITPNQFSSATYGDIEWVRIGDIRLGIFTTKTHRDSDSGVQEIPKKTMVLHQDMVSALVELARYMWPETDFEAIPDTTPLLPNFRHKDRPLSASAIRHGFYSLFGKLRDLAEKHNAPKGTVRNLKRAATTLKVLSPFNLETWEYSRLQTLSRTLGLSNATLLGYYRNSGSRSVKRPKGI